MPSDIQKNDKRFDKDCCEQFDKPAKQVGAEWLRQMGFENITENLGEANGQFKAIWDLKATHAALGEWRLDCEIKQDWGTVWTDEPFKYRTVDVPYRKRDKTQEHATHQMVIGGDLNRFFIVKREVMLDRDVTKITNKWCRNREAPEPFFNIPRDAPHSTFWVKKDDKWVISKA